MMTFLSIETSGLTAMVIALGTMHRLRAITLKLKPSGYLDDSLGSDASYDLEEPSPNDILVTLKGVD